MPEYNVSISSKASLRPAGFTYIALFVDLLIYCYCNQRYISYKDFFYSDGHNPSSYVIKRKIHVNDSVWKLVFVLY